jgi:pyrroline-5-carboxylate reductase
MRVGLIGAGNMARAIARGWGDPVLVSDSGSGRAQRLVDELGGRRADSLEVAREADVIVLCHKPYHLAEVAAQLAGTARAVVSVLGGVTLAALRDAYPATSVYRIEPNTPVEVRQGILLHASDGQLEDPETTTAVLQEFARLGWVIDVAESQMGAASGLSGVGPAYMALIAEAQADAAVRWGLTPALAGQLVAETMAGTAALLAARDYDTLAVRREVTSPGGSTARGLDALERGGLRTAFSDAMNRLHRATDPS